MNRDWAGRHRGDHIVLLLCVIGVITATWAAMSHANGVATWKFSSGVSVTIFLGLAALTPHAAWATGLRLVMSGWLVIASSLLAFSDVPLAAWSHLIAASFIGVWSAPYFLRRMALSADQDASFTRSPNKQTIRPIPGSFWR